MHLLILLIAGTVSVQAADVALLSDGDRITGTIQKVENGKLLIGSDIQKA